MKIRSIGYPSETIARVQTLNLKENFPADPDSRVLEDALCLVFLERQLAALAARSTEEQMRGVERDLVRLDEQCRQRLEGQIARAQDMLCLMIAG